VSEGQTIKALRNADIDSHPLLDRDQRKIVKIFRNKDRSITMIDFAKIALRATARDYTNASVEGFSEAITDRALRHAALLYVYEALKACDHDIIRQWPEFDTMLEQLVDLGTLGLP
jgi:hypothetical protein